MFRAESIALWIAWFGLVVVAYGQEPRYFQGVDGTTYQETRRIVQQPAVTTEWETQQRTTYRQAWRQDVRDTWRTYYTPVTEHCWVSRLHGRWNPFITPYFTHHLIPVTRWESRAERVQVPSWRSEWVPQTQTVRVPVTRQRIVKREVVEQVGVSNPPNPIGGPVVARQATVGPTRITRHPPYYYGGIALANDPPRQATGWRPSESVLRR